MRERLASRLGFILLPAVCAFGLQKGLERITKCIGAMTIFGSYIGRERTLLGEAVNVAVLDTVVAICAGLIIATIFVLGLIRRFS